MSQQTAASVLPATNLSNTVVTSTLANLEQTGGTGDANGNGILGYATDSGTLLYSASGNFDADAQKLLEIGGVEAGNFVPVRQITVV